MFLLMILFNSLGFRSANALRSMFSLFRTLATRLIDSTLLIYLSLGLIVTACSLESVSMELGEADQDFVDSGSLDDAIVGAVL